MDGKQKIMLVPFYDEMEEEEHWRIYEVSKSCKILLVAALYVMVRCATVHNFVYKNIKTSFILATSLLKKYVYWVIFFILITRTPKHRNRGKQKPKKVYFQYSVKGKHKTNFKKLKTFMVTDSYFVNMLIAFIDMIKSFANMIKTTILNPKLLYSFFWSYLSIGHLVVTFITTKNDRSYVIYIIKSVQNTKYR